jgi:hypothetical protein
VKEFMESPEGWVPADDSMFAAWEVGPVFTVMRSRTNYDPALHDGPEFDQIPPDVVPAGQLDCAGDVNADNVVNVEDLLLVLAAWGTGDVDADQAPPGGDGIVNVSDLLLILASWGPCP